MTYPSACTRTTHSGVCPLSSDIKAAIATKTLDVVAYAHPRKTFDIVYLLLATIYSLQNVLQEVFSSPLYRPGHLDLVLLARRFLCTCM